MLKFSNGLNVSEILNDSLLSVRTALDVLKETLLNKDTANWTKPYKTYKKYLKPRMVLLFAYVSGPPPHSFQTALM